MAGNNDIVREGSATDEYEVNSEQPHNIRNHLLDDYTDTTVAMAEAYLTFQLTKKAQELGKNSEDWMNKLLGQPEYRRELLQKKQLEVMIPSYGYDRCDFKRLEDEEKEKGKKEEEKSTEQRNNEAFLKDQRKAKVAEQRYFDRLERELERFETDEILLRFNQDMREKQA